MIHNGVVVFKIESCQEKFQLLFGQRSTDRGCLSSLIERRCCNWADWFGGKFDLLTLSNGKRNTNVRMTLANVETNRRDERAWDFLHRCMNKAKDDVLLLITEAKYKLKFSEDSGGLFGRRKIP